MHANGNIRGILIFISHGNSVEGILWFVFFLNKGKNVESFVHVDVVIVKPLFVRSLCDACGLVAASNTWKV